MLRRHVGVLMVIVALVAVTAAGAQAAGLAVTPAQDPPHAYLGQEYRTAFGVDPPAYDSSVTFTLAGGTLPDGLTFYSPMGVIIGTPTQALQSTRFTVRATDAEGQSATRAYTLSVDLLDPASNPLQQTVTSVLGLVSSLSRLPGCLPVILSGTFPRPC